MFGQIIFCFADGKEQGDNRFLKIRFSPNQAAIKVFYVFSI